MVMIQMMLSLINHKMLRQTIDEGNVAEVIADQYEVYGKGINVANRGYGQGPIRGAAHMMTDAQYKVQGIKGRPEEIIRSLSSREELQEMAERAQSPYG
jgi:hypothetical protein